MLNLAGFSHATRSRVRLACETLLRTEFCAIICKKKKSSETYHIHLSLGPKIMLNRDVIQDLRCLSGSPLVHSPEQRQTNSEKTQ
jgi:hypothetical protein